MAMEEVPEKVGFFVCAPNGKVYFVDENLSVDPVPLEEKETCIKNGVNMIKKCLNRSHYNANMVVLTGVGIKSNSKPRRPVAQRSIKK